MGLVGFDGAMDHSSQIPVIKTCVHHPKVPFDGSMADHKTLEDDYYSNLDLTLDSD